MNNKTATFNNMGMYKKKGYLNNSQVAEAKPQKKCSNFGCRWVKKVQVEDKMNEIKKIIEEDT